MANSPETQIRNNALAAAITLACCNTANAQFYGGFTAIYGAVDMDIEQTQTTFSPLYTSRSSIELGSDRRMGGSISLGYRWFRDDWLLSTELEYGRNTGRTDGNGLWYIEDFNEERRVSASVIAGRSIINDLYLTGKVGYTETDLKFNTSTPGITTFSDIDLQGTHVAIGLEKFFNKALFNRDISIRAEYGLTHYEDGDSNNSSPQTLVTNNYKDIENEMFTVGVTLEF